MAGLIGQRHVFTIAREPSSGKDIESTGAISWDGSFDAKRSGAITKTRPNDAPTLMQSPICHQKNRPFFTFFHQMSNLRMSL